ncbi:2-oxo acid dehydrogenase subunit E2 [Actinacidiphila bryophytorum]|uniref:2-oxo acid dehydrogenase subunit E2 n=1 Tax=Actinacidiphila bryophytorum TaxID=1436133 RepID=UPI0021769A94|nr:2-oxo acid dehydrogenase subunit E2 [Actinacidiphila bryophytorum]UWE08642.1 2-oxo acid dehydrogenase subunit E2 [Actinacidiphila bryophytorum]
MREVTAPRLNPNDETYLLVDWLVPDGAAVAAGDPLAALETAKVAAELESPCDGIVEQLVPAGGRYGFDHLVARIHAGASEPPDAGAVPQAATATASASETAPPPGGTAGQAPFLMSRAAAELAALHGLDEEEIAQGVRVGGRRLVRRADVERYAATIAARRLAARRSPVELDLPWGTLPAGQRAVADGVSRAHTEIPAAFTLLKVDTGPAEAWARGTDGAQRFRGLVELVVKAIAHQAAAFPAFFCRTEGDRRILGADPDIGVTTDVGHGLHLPVVRRPDLKTPAQIGDELLRFRLQSARGTFTRDQSADPTTMLALNTGEDTVLAIPLIFPGLTCAVSLGATIAEAAADAAGGIAVRRTATLGLAYDHRVINGRDAHAFLYEIRALLGEPTRLETLVGACRSDSGRPADGGTPAKEQTHEDAE